MLQTKNRDHMHIAQQGNIKHIKIENIFILFQCMGSGDHNKQNTLQENKAHKIPTINI